ncbi:Phage excisionase (Precursor) [Propionibacterium freudenreichii]|nr:Phage excisionase (Precursor) [Propionibacterium freudenreichii]SCQ69542.1 Phage excisionase (Precursor) [Propionibacterium freudenreichii]
MRREQQGRRWAAMTAVAGTVFIAAGAFWLSFTSLADLAARSGIGAGQAWAWPLIVDGIIVAADADVPKMLAASVAAVPPVVLLAITHLTVILTRTTEPDKEPADAASLSTTTAESMPALPSGETEAGRRDDGVADRRALGWELREAGWSNKRIARELGVHPSTVGRWFTVAHLTDTTDTAEREETTP